MCEDYTLGSTRGTRPATLKKGMSFVVLPYDEEAMTTIPVIDSASDNTTLLGNVIDVPSSARRATRTMILLPLPLTLGIAVAVICSPLDSETTAP